MLAGTRLAFMEVSLKSGLVLGLLLLSSVASAHPSVSIVQDKRGHVYYTDTKRVIRISPDDRVSVAVPNVHTHELALDSEDSLYGEHLWYDESTRAKWRHRVWRMSAGGAVSDVYPAREGFRENYSFVRDDAGNMYWADRGASTTIKRRTAAGSISTHVPSGLTRVGWMTSAKDGTLFVMDNGDLRRVTPQGALSTIAARISATTPPSAKVREPHYQMGLHAGADGNVYVAVSEERLILKVARDGARSVAVRSQTPWAPSGCVLDRAGRLWVLEYNPNNDMRVVRVEADGAQRAFSLK